MSQCVYVYVLSTRNEGPAAAGGVWKKVALYGSILVPIFDYIIADHKPQWMINGVDDLPGLAARETPDKQARRQKRNQAGADLAHGPIQV